MLYRAATWRKSSRRGSTLLIVLALLSLLVLLAATLAYTSKLDVIASRNFGENIQRNMIAVSSVEQAARRAAEQIPLGALGRPSLEFDLTSDTLDDDQRGTNWNGEGEHLFASVSDVPIPTGPYRKSSESLPGMLTSTSRVQFYDMSGRINVNTAPVDVLETLIREVANDRGLSVNARALAQAIVDRRHGLDNAPGQAGQDDNLSKRLLLPTEQDYFGSSRTSSGDDDSVFATNREQEEKHTRIKDSCLGDFESRRPKLDNLSKPEDDEEEYISDIRYPPFGDDSRFGNVGQLIQVQGMTPELFAALQPYMTVFSVNQEVRPSVDRDGNPLPLLDLNRASAEEIYDALVIEYGGQKADMLLRQFAVNIVDWRDEDSVPTRLESSRSLVPVLGLERTPFISEIYPDSRTEDDYGDDGQYVEIYNPWTESISLQGWRLRIAGMSFQLEGYLPPKSFLIVTDDYDNSQDFDDEDEIPGTGSFYDVFGRASNGSSQRVLEISRLNIPHLGGTFSVQLTNQNGALIDEFVYQIKEEISTLSSFQRPNVLVRESKIYRATPFDLAPEKDMPAEIAARLIDSPTDLPFTSVLELFEVFAGYANEDGTQGSRWDFPLMTTPRSPLQSSRDLAANPTRLDARLVDLFSIEYQKRRPHLNASRGSDDPVLRRDFNPWIEDFPAELLGDSDQVQPGGEKVQDAQAMAWTRFAAPPVGHREGRINVNTAPESVLEAVGFSQLAAQSIISRRTALERAFLAGAPGDGIMYRRLSDIVADDKLWTEKVDYCARLQEIQQVFDRITIGSRAFLLEGMPLEAPESMTQTRSGARVQALVAMDGNSPDIVYWRYIH